MLTEFRAAVHDTLAVGLPPGTPLWNAIPDDVNELPCVVVGRPGAAETTTTVVFDLRLEVFVIGRRQQAGQAEPEDELMALADAVWLVFQGTRGTRSVSGYPLDVRELVPRVLSIAGNDIPAYAIPVESSIATC